MGILLILPSVYAEIDPHYNCTIGSNFTTIPGNGENLTLAVGSNETLSFLFSMILFGDCSARNITIASDCPWCSFSSPFMENVTHGSNRPINANILVPPLPANLTNNTYTYMINLTARNEIITNITNSTTNATIYFNATRVETSSRFFLNVYVPYTVAFDSLTYIIPGTNFTLQNITDMISDLPTEEQLKLMLILKTVFGDQFNFSFVVKVHDIIEKQIPVVSVLPMSVEEYQRWQKSCNPLVYQEAQARADEAELKYGEVLNRTVQTDQMLAQRRDELQQCQDRLFQTQNKVDETVNATTLGAMSEKDAAFNTLVAGTLIIVGAVIASIFRDKFGLLNRNRKVQIPMKSTVRELEQAGKEEVELEYGEKESTISRLRKAIPKRQPRPEKEDIKEKQKTQQPQAQTQPPKQDDDGVDAMLKNIKDNLRDGK